MDLNRSREKLRYYRRMKRFTQQQLGELVGKDNQYICQLENGKIIPKLDISVKLESVLETPMKELFEDIYQDGNG